MSKQVQHQTAENVGMWDAVIEMGKKGKANAMQLDEDAAELNCELGGEGMQERVPSVGEMRSLSGKCGICFDTKTSGILVLPCCKGFKACLECLFKASAQKDTCPKCRAALPMPKGSTIDTSADESDEIKCAVCDDCADGDNNPILMCSGPHGTQHGNCDVAMHMKCLDHPPVSPIGVNCWCLRHWNRASLGDIKLAAPAGTSSARTTASDRSARMSARTGAGASTLAPAAAKGKKPGSSIAKTKKMRMEPLRNTAQRARAVKLVKWQRSPIAVSLLENLSKENIIAMAKNRGVQTVIREPVGSKQMRFPLCRIAGALAEKLTGGGA